MAVPVFLYDSFPARRFGGNVAGVVFLDKPAPRGWAQRIAAELGAPTTGFVDLPTARTREARVRFFTPRQEIGACGHVTVAIATALAEAGVWPMGEAAVSAAGGRYPLSLSDCGPGRVQVEMRQRLRHLDQPRHLPDLDGVLGPVQRSRQLPVTVALTGLRHLLVPARNADGLAMLPMAAARVAELSRALHVDTIGVFAVTGEDSEAVSVRMRDLCAAIGATEEPASGTTSAALAFALADAGLLTGARARLRVDMGIEMGRPSRLSVDMDFADGRPVLARLQGFADRVLSGEITAPA
jgi:trans-2,3-dihydro-3-hydroxyanthranilate isomerase